MKEMTELEKLHCEMEQVQERFRRLTSELINRSDAGGSIAVISIKIYELLTKVAELIKEQPNNP